MSDPGSSETLANNDAPAASKLRESTNQPPATMQRSAEGTAATPLGERVAWAALLVCVALVPVVTTNVRFFGIQTASLTFERFAIPKLFVGQVLVTLGLAAWGWELLQRGGRVRVHRLWWAAAALLVAAGLSTLLSVEWRTSLFGAYGRQEGLVALVYEIAAGVLAFQLVTSVSRMRTLARVVSLSGAAVAAYALVQYAGHDPVQWGAFTYESGRVFSFFGNPDVLGDYLVLPFSAALGLALFDRRSGLARGLMWLIAALCGAGLLVTFVRGAWLGAGAALAVIIVVRVARRSSVPFDPVDRLGLVGVAVALGALAIAASRSTTPTTNLLQRLESMAQVGAGTSAAQRLDIWRVALKAILQRPVLGWGPETFLYVFKVLRPVSFTRTWGWATTTDNAHNWFLQLGATYGLIGAILYFGLVVGVLVGSARLLLGRSAEPNALIATGLWAGEVGVVVALFFGVAMPGITLPIWIVLGALLAPTAQSREFVSGKGSKAASVVVVACAAVLVLWNATWLIADHEYRDSILAGNGSPQGVVFLRRASSINPLAEIYSGELGLALAARVSDPGLSNAAVPGALFSAVEALDRTRRRFPWQSDTYGLLASAYLAADQRVHTGLATRALAAARAGLALDPNDAGLLAEASNAQLALRDVAGALESAKRSTEADPNFAEGWDALGVAYSASAQRSSAASAFRRALQISPQDSLARAQLSKMGVSP